MAYTRIAQRVTPKVDPLARIFRIEPPDPGVSFVIGAADGQSVPLSGFPRWLTGNGPQLIFNRGGTTTFGYRDAVKLMGAHELADGHPAESPEWSSMPIQL
ncbi:hypothetical protein [Umezawaea sp. Da 62-37]|uniref:hypothetical protein n=1 Tax=Umezawaea sp. Da 62-37 TaxID=3075927 RepID=UPI0028F6DC85|nr:hypothetical protein [Umezawaea sp. Da 62-37]WNV82727.1 hypothetical protein RM788_31600 [Umezawaea sp. Da 62-37]